MGAFYDFICAPDNSFLYVKDEVHKLNFVTLFGLCWNIHPSQRLAHLTLIWSMFTCKVFRNIFCNFLTNYIFLQHTNISLLVHSQYHCYNSIPILHILTRCKSIIFKSISHCSIIFHSNYIVHDEQLNYNNFHLKYLFYIIPVLHIGSLWYLESSIKFWPKL